MKRHGRTSSVIALGALLALGGCAALLGFEELTERGEPDASTEPDAMAPDAERGDGDAPDAASSCRELPPQVTQNRPGKKFSFALRSLRLMPDTSRPIPGLNIDGRITTNAESSACRLADGGSWSVLTDDECGLDNLGITVFSAIGSDPATDYLGISSYDLELQRGAHGVLLVALDLDENFADDGFVPLQWYPARFLSTSEGCAPRWALDGGLPDVDAGNDAVLQPNDRWCIDPVFGSNEQAKLTSPAYVSKGILVAPFEDLYLPVATPFEPTRVGFAHFRNVVLTGRLQRDAQGLPVLVEGTLAGRWALRDVYYQLGARFLRRQDGGVTCDARQNAEFEELLQNTICPNRDVRAAGDDPSQPCDALSVGLGFETYAVNGAGPAIAPEQMWAWEYECDGRRDATGHPVLGGPTGVPLPPESSSDCAQP